MDYPTVPLGPFQVADLNRPALLKHLSRLRETQSQTVMFSLHVGGLNLRNDSEFVNALEKADVVVADGISVATLAKLAGASGLHRHPTTDAGWEILADLATELGRPVRVALIGGPAGLAERAAEFVNQRGHKVVVADHGYHQDWSPTLEKLAAAKPDVLFVGMGMPIEALWVSDHCEQLVTPLVITCGGWFGHIVGDEKRAPRWMQRAGLEWVARLAQQPGRLWKRYATGLWSTFVMIPTALRGRRAGKKISVTP